MSHVQDVILINAGSKISGEQDGKRIIWSSSVWVWCSVNISGMASVPCDAHAETFARGGWLESVSVRKVIEHFGSDVTTRIEALK